MKLIQLRYLVAVAENDLNITQAARVLHAARRSSPIRSASADRRRWSSGVLLRGYIYDFLQMLAPHLTQRQVQAAESASTQEEVDREFAAVKIPFLR